MNISIFILLEMMCVCGNFLFSHNDSKGSDHLMCSYLTLLSHVFLLTIFCCWKKSENSWFVFTFCYAWYRLTLNGQSTILRARIRHKIYSSTAKARLYHSDKVCFLITDRYMLIYTDTPTISTHYMQRGRSYSCAKFNIFFTLF